MMCGNCRYGSAMSAELEQRLSETELNEVQAEIQARGLYKTLTRVLDGLHERDWAFGEQVMDMLDRLSHLISVACCRNGR